MRGHRRSASRSIWVFVLALVLLSSTHGLAAVQTLGATIGGAQETPPNGSMATGTCTATVDPSTLDVTFSGTFVNLTASATAAALRGLSGPGATAPVLLAPGTLTSGTSGTFSGSGTLTPEQVAGLLASKTYCEVDDPAFPSGEIRGQLSLPSVAPALMPVDVAWVALALGGAGIVLLRARERATRRLAGR